MLEIKSQNLTWGGPICSFVSSGRKFKYEILINVDLNLVRLLEMERNQLISHSNRLAWLLYTIPVSN